VAQALATVVAAFCMGEPAIILRIEEAAQEVG